MTTEQTNNEVTMSTFQSPLTLEQIREVIAGFAPLEQESVDQARAKIQSHNDKVNDKIAKVKTHINLDDTDSLMVASARIRELQSELVEMPTDDRIRLRLSEKFVDEVLAKMQLGMAVLKKRGGGEETFQNRWAVKLAYKGFTLRAVNFRKLTASQKDKYKMTNANQWLLSNPRLSGHHVSTVSNVGELLKETRTFINNEEYTSPVSKAEFDNAIDMSDKEISEV